ncbi:MAG: alkaline shock response membrane anchor protein AmaP [Candidatus Omnitrophica bacterium]|nr:alkaline shock response membrane anchor protein AmaP [Candidatus Omnitrophota bacterium]
MRIFTIIAITFYAAVITILGTVMIIISLNLVSPQMISDVLLYTLEGVNARIIIGLTGGVLILVSISFAQLIFGKFQREKTIAFITPSGEVTIALSAVEDLIRRLVGIIPEIKELRPDVKATKKGIEVEVNIVLRAETNIPELTSRLQDIIKSKIQEVVGTDEDVFIKIHVIKIITIDERDKKRKEPEEKPAIPFGGYGKI